MMKNRDVKHERTGTVMRSNRRRGELKGRQNQAQVETQFKENRFYDLFIKGEKNLSNL